MPGSRLYDFRLAQPQFEVTPFQAVAFEPKTQPNVGLLSDAFAKIADREQKYTEKLAAMDTQFAKLKETLSPDDATARWFENYKKKYRETITEFANSGDYENAINFGTRLAAEALNDGELQGHTYAYSTYKQERDANKQRVNNGVSNLDYEYWEYKNQFNPEKIDWTLVDGKVTGAKDYKTTVLYDSIDYAKDIYAKGYQLINPDVISTSEGKSTSTSHGGPKGSSSKSHSESNSHSLEKVTAEELLKVWDNLVLTTGDDIERIQQDFESKKYHVKVLEERKAALDPSSQEYKDLQSVIDSYNRVLTKNNSPIDYKEYYCRMISGAIEGDNNVAKIMADNMAYTKESTGHDVSDSTSSTSTKDGGGGGGGHHRGRRSGGRGGNSGITAKPGAPGQPGAPRTYTRDDAHSNYTKPGPNVRQPVKKPVAQKAGVEAGKVLGD